MCKNIRNLTADQMIHSLQKNLIVNFGLAGGGSSAMLFQGEYVRSSSRKVQDAIYFTALK